MAQLEELVVKLTAQNDELVAAMKSSVAVTEKSANAMSSALDVLAKNTEKDTAGMATAWAVMAGELASQAVMSALGAVKDLFVDVLKTGVQGAIETQDALKGLNNALALSGNYSVTAAQGFEDLADELEMSTKFSDTQVLSATRLLASLTNLSAGGLDKATRASADLATALGVDLDTAARLISKSIEGNDSALKKYGISLGDVGTGADRADKIFAKLNEKFGGSAKAQMSTFGGAIELVGKSFENFAKEIGKVLISNKAVNNVLTAIIDIFAKLNASIEGNSTPVNQFIDQMVSMTVTVGKALLTLADFVTRVFNTIGTTIGVYVGHIMNTLDAASKALEGDFSSAWQTFADSGVNAFQQVKESAVGANPVLDTMRASLDEIGKAAERGYGQVVASAAAVAPGVAGADAASQMLLQTTRQQEQALIDLGVVQLAQSEQQRALLALDAESNQLALDAGLISQADFYAAKNQLLLDSLAAETLALDGARNSNAITQEAYQAKILELQRKAANDKTKLDQDQKKAEDAMTTQRLQNASSFFGNMATLSQTGNKELAAIGKASAISQATIDGVLAVQKALASAPPPVNIALAAAAGVAAAVNVAKIASTPLATGIDEVPGVGSKDNFPAMLAPGERVVPAETNQDLKEFLGKGASSGPNITVNLHDVYTTDPRTLGRVVVDAINEYAQVSGASFVGVKLA